MSWQLLLRGVLAAIVVIAVSEVGRRLPRLGALLLTLPLVSVVAFVTVWTRDHDLPAASRLARETLVLVPLGLPFFIPLAFAGRHGLAVWPALAARVSDANATHARRLRL